MKIFKKFDNSNGGGIQYPNTIVIHAMAEYLRIGATVYHASEFLKKYGLSAHALVDDNANVFLTREENKIAWHAKGHNINSLGMEFLVPIPEGKECFDNYDQFLKAMRNDWTNERMIDAGVEIVKGWKERHDIRKVTRHVDIDPDRKEDPGAGFPWESFLIKISDF